jgi:hypothetical protein
MGDQVEQRREFIEKNARRGKQPRRPDVAVARHSPLLVLHLIYRRLAATGCDDYRFACPRNAGTAGRAQPADGTIGAGPIVGGGGAGAPPDEEQRQSLAGEAALAVDAETQRIVWRGNTKQRMGRSEVKVCWSMIGI